MNKSLRSPFFASRVRAAPDHATFVGALIGAVVLLAGCGDDAAPPADGGSTGSQTSGQTGSETGDETGTDGADETGSTSSRTFWGDVAPIYFDSCVTCHREGGIGPFALDNYADAVTWAAATQLAVTERTMPPWLAQSDGECGDFVDSRALSDEEVDTITEWVESEQAQGDPRDDLEVPQSGTLEGATDYVTPNFEPEIVGGPLAEFDEYRCFLIEPGLASGGFLTGYDIIPGNDAILHHVLGFILEPDETNDNGVTNLDRLAALDAESPDRAGWPCFEGAGEETEDESLPIAWAPGQGAVEFPHGTGVPVNEGDMVVVQVHYNLADPANIGSSDETQVRIRFEDEVENPTDMFLPDLFLETLFEDEPAVLPMGEASVEYTWEIPVAYLLGDSGLDSLTLYGVLPHMHEFGQRIRLDVVSSDAQTCAVNVPAWDFNWQLMYFYEEPITLSADQTLSVTCDYNTLNAEGPVTPGWGTQNEMCLMGMVLGG